MDLSTITVSDFMTQFKRDFPYLDSIIWSGTQNYVTGQIVYASDGNFYQSLQAPNLNQNPVTTPAFWTPYAAGNILNYVSDDDINNAFNQALVVFNQGLWGTPAAIKLAYLYLTAFYLCIDFKNADAGLASGSAAGIMTGRSVGSVSESYAIPQRYLDDPVLAAYTVNGYGMKYLTLALPNLVGNTMSAFGGTNP